MVELLDMTYIVKIAECRSLTKAAAELFTTQSTLSHRLSKIENELQVKLFNRSTIPISLTYAGEIYVQNAQYILTLIDGLNKIVRDISNNLIGCIRIGLPHSRATYMLPYLIPAFQEEYPNIKLDICTENSTTLKKRVKESSLDIIIAPYDGDKDNELKAFPVANEERVFVIKKGYVDMNKYFLDGTKNVDLKKAAELPFIMTKEGHSSRIHDERLFDNLNIKPNISLEAPGCISALFMIAAGVGCAIIPAVAISVSDCKDEIETYSIGENKLYWSIMAFTRKNSYVGDVEHRLIDIVTDLYTKRITELE